MASARQIVTPDHHRQGMLDGSAPRNFGTDSSLMPTLISVQQWLGEQIVPAFFEPHLSRSTNLVENFFRFIDRRITPMDRFQGEDTAQAMVKLILLWYRFHKFTNPSKPYWYMKGKSPLQLAGVKTSGLNWLKVGLGK